MAKYKVGDKVRIVSKRPQRNWNPEMDPWLGKTMTIVESGISHVGVYYNMEEDSDDPYRYWYWYENMIAGLAEPERGYTVELRFDGMITTAALKRGGRDVKTAEARCNPKDTYSRAEGARVAVERLFEKKRKEGNPKESRPKIGDKFVIVGNHPFGSCHHFFKIGSVVELVQFWGARSSYVDARGTEQTVLAEDVRPYKENAK